MKFQMESLSISKLSLALLLITCPAASVYAAAAAPVRHVDYKNMAMVPVEVSGFNGWSVGGGLGVNTTSVSSSVTNTSLAVDSPFLSGVPGSSFNTYARNQNFKFGPMGSLFAGYGYLRDIYYVGVNAGINIIGARTLQSSQFSRANDTITDTNLISAIYYESVMQTTTKVTRGWAEPFLDIKIGGLITPQTLAYGILGVSYNTLNIKSSSRFNTTGEVLAAPPAVSSTSSYGYQTNKSFFGLRLGAGMEVLLTERVGVGADYVYSFYPKYTTSTSATLNSVACDTEEGCAVVTSTMNNYTKTSMNDQQVMAKVTYHLG